MKYITHEEVQELTGLHRVTIWRLYKSKKFPIPFYKGNRLVWSKAEVSNWMKILPRKKL